MKTYFQIAVCRFSCAKIAKISENEQDKSKHFSFPEIFLGKIPSFPKISLGQIPSFPEIFAC